MCFLDDIDQKLHFVCDEHMFSTGWEIKSSTLFGEVWADLCASAKEFIGCPKIDIS